MKKEYHTNLFSKIMGIIGLLISFASLLMFSYIIYLHQFSINVNNILNFLLLIGGFMFFIFIIIIFGYMGIMCINRKIIINGKTLIFDWGLSKKIIDLNKVDYIENKIQDTDAYSGIPIFPRDLIFYSRENQNGIIVYPIIGKIPVIRLFKNYKQLCENIEKITKKKIEKKKFYE